MKKTVLDQIPEHIRALAGYVPGKPLRQAERESGMAMIKMASNENPFGPSPLALAAIREAAAEVNLYPDNDASELREALAARHQLAAEQIFIGDGSLGILDVVARTLLVPGTNCISSERSFISYPVITRSIGARFIDVPMRNDTYDLDAIAAAIDEQTRVVILANPNNPTGTMFDADATEAFLERVPESVLVILDEAYVFALIRLCTCGQIECAGIAHVFKSAWTGRRSAGIRVRQPGTAAVFCPGTKFIFCFRGGRSGGTGGHPRR
jgi:histidinol-phosphate aminotransferase